ncbi:Peptide-methionine (S)-S-oxide reductase MsrA [hydrothermal vent metagenome]|uniref:peptide-methionine (S)-S-oxide reductase n=1 Tax=hydrothermal vent metagenome TaxID=652676 RepID=A0A3B1DQF6_9ZZZZ
MAALATFGAGCFWGVEATFRALNGVTETAVGYMGGKADSPSYQNVCTGSTGHAEIVQIEFDPAIISYEKLLDTFWNSHNPTTLNRQGPDIGTQYRSVIFFHNEDQQQTAIDSKNKLDQSDRFSNPVVTEIVPATTFHRAEEYHQQYLEKGGQSSCHL